jgi:uncharacterized protein YbjQ (UPF0145 family)
MKITTTENVAGRLVEETLGVVRGTGFWSRRVTKHVICGQRSLRYPSLEQMSDGLQLAKEQAEAKARELAVAMGADAIISMRLEIIEMGNDTYQAVATGTAVKTEPMPSARPYFGMAANDDAFDTSYMPPAGRPELRLVSSMMH